MSAGNRSAGRELTAAAAGTLRLGGAVEIRRVGLGARWLPRAGAEDSKKLLREAVELGVNLIDTADVYGRGESERLIAAALHPYPDDLVIATKGGQRLVNGKPRPDGRPEHIRAACEESLSRLRVEAIDLYQLHCPDPEVPLEDVLGALVGLQREGKIRMVGLSNFYGSILEQALGLLRVVSLQNRYSVFKRPSEQEISRCEREGLVFLPWTPLGSGALNDSGALAAIAAAHGATPAQVALAWLLRRSPAIVPIPGTSSSAHLAENVGAALLELDAADYDRLAAAAT